MSELSTDAAKSPKGEKKHAPPSGAHVPHDDHDDHEHHAHPHLAHHFDTPQQQFEAGKLGIWLFLVTEVLFFAGLFCAYAIYRSQNPEVFVYAHYHLNTNLGAVNTTVLLFSSLTAAWAVRCAQLRNKTGLIVNILVTVACACTFMVVKYFEYSHKAHEGLLWGKNFKPHHEPWQLEDFKHKHPEAAALAEKLSAKAKAGETKPGGAAAAPQPTGTVAPTATTAAAVDTGSAPTAAAAPTASAADTAAAPTASAAAGEAQAGEAATAEKAADPPPTAEPGQEDKPGATPKPTAKPKTPGKVAAKPKKKAAEKAPAAGEKAPAEGMGSAAADEAAAQAKRADTVGPGVASSTPPAGATPVADAPGPAKAVPDLPPEMLTEKAVRPLVDAGMLPPNSTEITRPKKAHIFFGIYFFMTGLHGLHVLIGIGIWIWMLVRATKGVFSEDYFGPIDYTALYWHLVDLIWIYLFPLLYLIH